jgi:hypothetical protein
MEKHYTHKNVSSIRKQRERERVHFFYLAGDRTGCQICQRNKIAGQRERRMAVSHTHTHTERERERVCRRQIRSPNLPEKQNGRPEREGWPFHRERTCAPERERERERERHRERERERAFHLQPVFRSKMKEKKKKKILKIVYTQLDVPMLC